MWFGVAAPFVVFELAVYTCLGLCAWHALRQGALRRARLIELGTGVLYGLTLETLTILQFHSYAYGHFLVMLGAVPLAIGVGWGIILYSAMAFADMLTLPGRALPAVVGLLGLNIDLGMDAVAIRLHMWQWVIGLNQQWFGVPYGNFYAWFIVLCSASALLWRARPLTARSGWRGPLAALGALLGSVLILTVLDELEVQYYNAGGLVWLPMALVLAGALVVAGWGVWAARTAARQPAVEPTANEFVPMVVPFFFHLFFLAMLFVAGIAAHLPVLVGISLTMLAISLALHGRLARHALAARRVPVAATSRVAG